MTSFPDIMGGIADEITRDATKAVRTAADGLKQRLVAETGAALGPKLARAWTTRETKTGAVVSTKAPRIIAAFTSETIITANNWPHLAIPLEAAFGRFDKDPKTGRRGAAIDRARQVYGELSFVPVANGCALLVARPRGQKPVPLFLLVQQVTLDQRLDLDAAQTAAVEAALREFAQ